MIFTKLNNLLAKSASEFLSVFGAIIFVLASWKIADIVMWLIENVTISIGV